jgi:hypothetical protein
MFDPGTHKILIEGIAYLAFEEGPQVMGVETHHAGHFLEGDLFGIMGIDVAYHLVDPGIG